MRETWHEHYIHKMLPEGLAESCAVSMGIKERLNIIQGNLKIVFGDRANWKRNIEKYYSSKEYHSFCRNVKEIGDLPELSFDDIKTMVGVEINFTKSTNEILSLLPDICGKDSEKRTNSVIKAASIIGLNGPSDNALYKWMIDWSEITRDEIDANISNHYANFEIAVKNVIVTFIPGFLVSYPIIQTQMTQQKQRYYYRGENAFYGSSKPGCYRWADKNIPDYVVKRVNDLRRDEGCAVLDNFIAVAGWPYSSVNHLALAQHYGLQTMMIDITSDIKTALFFACCTYENGKWRPLSNSDFERVDSRKGIYAIGGDSRYGVLYRGLEEITEMEWAYLNEESFLDLIVPIGFQPFMRCKNQYAYGIFTFNDKYDLYGDRRFEKFKFRLTEEICNWIFDQTKQGKDIYPNADIPDISRYFEKINKSKIFSRSNFIDLLKSHNVPEEQWCILEQELKQYGFLIDENDIKRISDEEIAIINNAYPLERAMELTGLEPKVDPIFIVGSGKKFDQDRKLDEEKFRYMIVRHTK